jgi:hypothetical protein
MSRGSPTIAFRVSKAKRLALVKAGRMCGGLSPGQYTDRIVTERLVSDGLLPADLGANSGANSGAFPTPEAPRPPVMLTDQFKARLTTPAPYWPNRKLASPPGSPATPARQSISSSIAHRKELIQADAAVTANRQPQDRPPPGMMSEAAIGMPPSLRRR